MNSCLRQYDLVITKMLAEHIKYGRRFHANVFWLLKPGGWLFIISHPVFPVHYQQADSDWLSSILLDIFLPRDRYRLGKLRAYYSWCFGPTPAMLNMLVEAGYEILEFRGCFGHTYYTRIPLLKNLHETGSAYLSRHPIPQLTSFAQVILRRPKKVAWMNN
jgi:hypothetical protein